MQKGMGTKSTELGKLRKRLKPICCDDGRGRAEKEFLVEVEAIGRVRHKNLVQLLGYCAEGTQR
jgi:hypothetical protein